MASRVEEQLRRAREKAEKEFAVAETERKKTLLKRRVHLANEGVHAYEAGRWTEALRAFQTYIAVLEHWKNAGEGGLSPTLFDRKVDVTEILLISGVYWDLAKLYDRTKTKQKELKHYLDKYVLFSRGMPFQPMCAEALRKYIANGKTVHTAEFKRAYKSLSTSKCFVVTSLVDLVEPGTLPLLRGYRDDTLLGSRLGRAGVRLYYGAGPLLASALDRSPARVRVAVARGLDRLATRVARKQRP